MRKFLLGMLLGCLGLSMSAKPTKTPILEGGSYRLVDYQEDYVIACLDTVNNGVFIWFDDKNTPHFS